jgi:hypothetical protein
MSPGIVVRSGASPSTGHTEASRGPRRARAPIASSIRSVWSRLGCGSTAVVGPSCAKRPAKSTHDFTWALATGSSHRTGSSPSPDGQRRGVGRLDARQGPQRLRDAPIGREPSDRPRQAEPAFWPESWGGAISVPAPLQSSAGGLLQARRPRLDRDAGRHLTRPRRVPPRPSTAGGARPSICPPSATAPGGGPVRDRLVPGNGDVSLSEGRGRPWPAQSSKAGVTTEQPCASSRPAARRADASRRQGPGRALGEVVGSQFRR